MSRPPVTGLRPSRPAVTSWFLLALTALAALLGSGLEVGGRSELTFAALSTVDPRAESPAAETDRPADARVPFVGAVLGAAPSTAASPAEPGTSGDAVVLAAPLGVIERSVDQPTGPTQEVLGGSGRAPPVTTGT